MMLILLTETGKGVHPGKETEMGLDFAVLPEAYSIAK